MSANDDLSVIVDVFRSEAHELLQEIGDAVLKLEKLPPGEERSKVAAVAFRHAHSIKGAATTLDMDRVTKIVHALEEVIAVLRDGVLVPTHDVLDAIFSALDAIDEVAAKVQPGDIDLLPAHQSIVDLLHGVLPADPVEPDTASAPTERAESATQQTDCAAEPAEPNPHEGQPPDSVSRQEPAQASQADAQREQPVEPSPRPEPQRPLRPAPTEAARQTPAEVDQAQVTAFVRISQDKLDRLLAQLGDLVEMRIRMEETLKGVRSVDEELERLERVDQRKLPRQALQQLGRGMEQDTQYLTKLLSEVQDELTELRMTPVASIFPVLRRAVRDVCRRRNLEIDLMLEGGEYELDRKIVENIKDPLLHILRNAADHGIEPPEQRRAVRKPTVGKILLQVFHRGNNIRLDVSDDGRGIDFERVRKRAVELNLPVQETAEGGNTGLVRLLFASGMSTADSADSISGRGVGLDAVKKAVENLRGTISAESEEGLGTTFQISLPLTLATDMGLFVRVGDTRFVIPRTAVKRAVAFSREDVSITNNVVNLKHADQRIPLGHLHPSLSVTPFFPREGNEEYRAVILGAAEASAAVVVDAVEAESEIVVRSLGTFVRGIHAISGLTITAAGEMFYVLNPSDLVRAAIRSRTDVAPRRASSGAASPSHAEQFRDRLVLVVDDSVTSRTLNHKILSASGFNVTTARDGRQALEKLRAQRCDLVLTDAQMPEVDGFELIRSIRLDPRLAETPVILLTALDGAADKERGLEAGADAYLVKHHLTHTELIETIAQLI